MPPAGIVSQDILTTHSDVEAYSSDWDLYRRSYVGGSEYKNGEYLIKHEKETNASFNRRLAESTFVNYSAPVIDIYNSYLFRETPRRTLGGETGLGIGNEALSGFWADADLRGRSFPTLMRELSKWAAVYGHVGVVIDKPAGTDAVSRAEELRYGIRPYITHYMPADIVNWGFETNYNGPPALEYLVLREESYDSKKDVFRIWYRDGWELWSVEKSNNSGNAAKPERLGYGDNTLGRIPFVLIRNKDSFDQMSGVSDLVDIAPINQRIYRHDSAALEIINRTAYPFLEVPVDKLGKQDEGDVIIGTGNVLERDIGDGIGHRWVEPGHASLERIIEWRAQAVQDIREAAKMGTSQTTNRQGAAASSGAALEVTFQQLNAVLANKAALMEQAETSILGLVAELENVAEAPEVHYPRKFGVRDIATDIGTALTAKELIISPVYDKLVQKSIAGRTLSDLGYTRIDISEAEKDIDAQDYVPTVQQLAVTGGPNGVSVIETTQEGRDARGSLVGSSVSDNNDNNNNDNNNNDNNTGGTR